MKLFVFFVFLGCFNLTDVNGEKKHENRDKNYGGQRVHIGLYRFLCH